MLRIAMGNLRGIDDRPDLDEIHDLARRSMENPMIRAVLDSIEGLVMILDKDRRVLAANPELLESMDLLQAESLVGQRPGDAMGCIHTDEGPDGCGSGPACIHCGALVSILASQEQKVSVPAECCLSIRKGGRLEAREFRVRSTPLIMGAHRLTVLVLQDISAEKRRQVLEAMFFHDVRNAVQGITAWSEALGVAELDPQGVARKILELSTQLNEQVTWKHRLFQAEAGTLPRAVVAVHLFGQPADMDSILELCRRYEVGLLEDAAEALGATYKGRPVGLFGDVATFSFNGNKVITSTGGGLLTARHPDWIQRARHWSTQACDPDPAGTHEYVHSQLGYNYRLSNVLAGIALGQLEVLEERIAECRAVFERYRLAFTDLPGVEPQPEAKFGAEKSGAGSQELEAGSQEQEAGSQKSEVRSQKLEDGREKAEVGSRKSEIGNRNSLHTRWLSCFLIDEARFGMSAADLIRYLDAANVEARPVWKPMHTQPLYRGYECVGGEVAEDLNRRGICLPSSSCLMEEEQQFVIDRVREAHTRARRE